MGHVITRWWWIRHAPVLGVNGRIYGQDDLDADCSHRPTFERLARMLPDPALWIASHLRRTQQTAAAILRAAGRDPGSPVISADLAEQHFGDWQGLTYAELEAKRDGAYHRFWHAPASARAPNGESFEEVIRRVESAIDRFTGENFGRDIVAVAHGGTIRAALAATLRIDPERALGFEIDTCSVTRIDHIEGATEGASWRIVAVNQHPDALERLR